MANQRITLEETEGYRRSYSYLLPADDELELGVFLGDSELPESVEAELESLAQSSSAPDFLWEPQGMLTITVEKL